jgi:hypothetical protein
MTNNNMWDCADMTLIFFIFSVFLVCKYIPVIHFCFQNKNLYGITYKKYGFDFFWDSLYITNSPYDNFLCQFLLEPFLKIHNHRTTKLQI